MGTRKNDLGRLRSPRNVQHISLDTITLAIRLSRHLLTAGKNGFRTTKVDHNASFFKAAHNTRNKLALAVAELIEGHFPLGIPNLLNNDLLRRLGCDPAQGLDLHFHTQGVANFAIGIQFLSDIIGQLSVVILDCIHNSTKFKEFYLSQLLVVLGFNVPIQTVALTSSGFHCGFQNADHGVTRDILYSMNLINEAGEIAGNHGDSPVA